VENIEIKSRYSSLSRARAIAVDLGARQAGVISQTDTYFHAPNGRLKLRQEDPGVDQLIFYVRPDKATAKLSRYQTVPLVDSAATLELLAAALGIRGRVRKRRELWRLDNVRIHLDEVEELGTFVEFEVMVSERDGEALCRGRADVLIAAFAIDDAALISGSYVDLLELQR
jgi:predicted adenylyl cyclase CyaB